MAVVPAHAGVILLRLGYAKKNMSSPRTCRGDPEIEDELVEKE